MRNLLIVGLGVFLMAAAIFLATSLTGSRAEVIEATSGTLGGGPGDCYVLDRDGNPLIAASVIIVTKSDTKLKCKSNSGILAGSLQIFTGGTLGGLSCYVAGYSTEHWTDVIATDGTSTLNCQRK